MLNVLLIILNAWSNKLNFLDFFPHKIEDFVTDGEISKHFTNQMV